MMPNPQAAPHQQGEGAGLPKAPPALWGAARLLRAAQGVHRALEQAAGVKFGMRGAGFNASLKIHFKRVNSSFFN